MKRALQLVLVLALGAGALWLALREVHVDEFVAALRTVRPGMFALGFASFLLLHILRAVRWGGLVDAVKDGVSFRTALSICSVGFMLINLLPFRLGEFTRPYLLLDREDVPFGSGMATVLVERVLDVVALGVIFVGVLAFADVPAYTVDIGEGAAQFDLVRAARTGILGVLIPVGIAIVLLLILGDRGVALVERLRDRMPALLRLPLTLGARFLSTFLVALRSLGSVRRAVPVVFWTGALWFLNVLSIYCTVRAFPFGDVVDFWGAATILVVICLALIAPAPPGFAGVFEFACTVALAIFAIGPSQAAAFAVLLHGSQFVLVTVIGVYFVAVDKISMRALMDTLGQLREQGGAEAT